MSGRRSGGARHRQKRMERRCGRWKRRLKGQKEERKVGGDKGVRNGVEDKVDRDKERFWNWRSGIVYQEGREVLPAVWEGRTKRRWRERLRRRESERRGRSRRRSRVHLDKCI